jgi:hypothetical protein
MRYTRSCRHAVAFQAGRLRVLRAWTASPARFRADANDEEDYALGPLDQPAAWG